MFDGRWRHAVDRTTKPVGKALVRTGVTADVLTVFGLVMSVVTAFAVGSGHLVWGIVLLFPTGLPDLFDGPVAKAAGTASIRGAFFDSVADRVSDAFMFGGVSWYLAAHHDGQLVLLPFAILALTALISYQRAKAELLGLSANGGLMERAERFILLGVCFVAGAVSPSAFVPALWVFFGLITATAGGRFVRVWQEAEGPVRVGSTRPSRGRVPERAVARRRDARVDSRWRTWRETRAQRDATGVHFVQPQRADQPLHRWRARRQSVIASRSGRIWRARRAERPRERSGRRPGAGGS
ncbi:MAG TPA: CDP-alcohol phosphatidyltransferase family protein [Acidimicrobiales bacterium]|nr:CDP-alcohol phosphatidyltransferase family protein [Acidimicrobiales bacterium]